MDRIQIVDYNESFDKNINDLLLKQWNENFVHNNKIVGKVALVNENFVGVCTGRIKYSYYLFERLCIDEQFRGRGIGTMLVEQIIDETKQNLKNRIGGGV